MPMYGKSSFYLKDEGNDGYGVIEVITIDDTCEFDLKMSLSSSHS
jgi:hypothetical protein